MPFPLSKFIQLFPVSFKLNPQVFGFTQLVLTALVTQKHSILYLLFKYDFLSECELTDCGQQQAPPTRYSVFLGQLSSFPVASPTSHTLHFYSVVSFQYDIITMVVKRPLLCLLLYPGQKAIPGTAGSICITE